MNLLNHYLKYMLLAILAIVLVWGGATLAAREASIFLWLPMTCAGGCLTGLLSWKACSVSIQQRR